MYNFGHTFENFCILRHPTMLTLNIKTFVQRFIHFLKKSLCGVLPLPKEVMFFGRDGLSVRQ